MTVLRRAVQFLALLAIILLLPITLMGLWARAEIYDSDTYLESVGNLASNEDVQEAVAHRIVTEAERRLAGESWQEFVESTVQDPELEAELLEIESGAGAYIESTIIELMQTPQFQQLWVDINRDAQPVIEQILRGQDTEAVESSNGAVRINLYPVYREVESVLFSEGIDLGVELQIDREDLWLTVFEGDRLVQVQEAVQLLNRGIAVAFVLLVSLPIVYLLVSRRRWLAGAVLGMAAVLGMGIHALLLGAARQFLTDAAVEGTEREAVRVVFDEVTDSLWLASGTIAVVGIIIFVLFLTGHFVRRRHDPYAIDW